MEKIFIKPVAKEILIKGPSKDGSTDLFSYDYESDHAKRKLGNLFVVGNVQSTTEGTPEDLDVGYVINLIASLAKREYFSKPDASPKDAFSSALKKINGVVEEFFKKQDTKVNVGIFAIAGEQIHISKLGKFKIVLSREGKNIDILNNVDLFDTEETEEKEFSNIVSGKVHEGDRLLAFYPSRVITAREKSIKESLLKTDQDGFAAKLAAIKEQKPDFACAALHIDVQRATEAAVDPKPQPKELQEEVEESPKVQLASEEDEEIKEEVEEKEESKSEKKEEAPVVIKGRKAVTAQEEPQEIPHIIPTEFSLGKRQNPFLKNARRIKSMNINPRTKFIALGGLAVLALGGIVLAKSLFFVSPADKQLNQAVSSVESNIKLAQTKINQKDLLGARSLLVSSLATIANNTEDKAKSAREDALKVLDSIDNATDATLSTAFTVPDADGSAQLITSFGDGFYVYMQQDDKGYVSKASGTSLGNKYDVSITPDTIFASENYITMLDSANKKVSSLSLKKSTVANTSLSLTSIGGAYVFQDNLYAISGDAINKITDASSGHTDSSTWLKSGTTLANNSLLIAVDGKVYVLSGAGVMTTYYKGAKTNETNIPVAPDASSILLTTADSPNLFLVDRTLGRIYVITKDSGSITKTLKLGDTKIQSAALDSHDTLFVLSNNRIWKVQ